MSAGVTFGRFELLELLGSGGMAEVWRARVNGAEGFTRDVVVKRILAGRNRDPEFAAMFAREARLSARLHHSNIVQVFDYGVVEGDPYLAMEYVDGVDLHWVLGAYRKAGRRLPPALAAYVAREVARALKHVHEARAEDGQPLGLVHRDISPSNVLLTVDGAVKLFDFGIAKSTQEQPLTATGGFRGKVAYSAPEIVEGKPYDARSDVFALGIVLYEMLSGRRLFHGETDAQTFGLVRAAVVKPLSETDAVDPALDAVCLRALARLPGDRCESAEAFIAELDPLVRAMGAGPEQLAAVVKSVPRRKLEPSSGSRTSDVLPPHTALTPARSVSRWRGRAIGAALLVLGLAVAFGLTRRGDLTLAADAAALSPGASGVTATAAGEGAPATQPPPRAPGEGAGAAQPTVAAAGGSSDGVPGARAAQPTVAAMGGSSDGVSGAPAADAPKHARAGEPPPAPDGAGRPGAARADGAGSARAGDAAPPGTGRARPPLERYVVRSAPSGATVKTDHGEVLGTTPLERSWNDGERPLRLLLERPGYERSMLELPPHGRVLTVALKPRRAKANDAAEQVDLRDGNVVDPFR